MPKRIRSDKDPALPPSPPKRRAISHTKNTSENIEYVLRNTTQSIPNSLGAKNVSGCSIEFLDIGPYDVFMDGEDPVRTNHAVLRLTFQHEKRHATPHAPAKTKGLILDLTPNGKQADLTAEGELMAHTRKHSGL
ncbi:uncharacterized protein N7529_003014 [Penicillium soppii]|uniref:uncharacterized protein n=1 Tax=Penicillium soppii TaxID=69789 RepID=UPI0025468527|nr:uncharacterized protein N7529_003014 [Penicillium soppii]KAJ5874584.1 hypothetical protein N7529_003014 [Penicillium soppii]